MIVELEILEFSIVEFLITDFSNTFDLSVIFDMNIVELAI